MEPRTRSHLPRVTERQREVARLVAEGRTNLEIAERLGITLDGAKYHVSELLTRLGLERRRQIADWYQQDSGARSTRGLRALGAPWLVWSVGAGSVAIAALVAIVLFTGLHSALVTDGEYPIRLGSAASEPTELERRGYIDSGPLLLADGADFRSDVRAGLTTVNVPPDVEFDVEDSWTVLPTIESAYDFRFSRTLDDRQFYVWLHVTDAEGDDQTFRWRIDAPHAEISDQVNPSPDDSVLFIQVYSGAPFVLGLPPQHAPDAGWHEAAIDAHGHLWIHPHPESAIALDTGEAIDTSGMHEIEWWPVRMPYSDLMTLCGGSEPGCFVISKGGMYLPFSMAGEMKCAPRSDGFGLAATLSATKGDLTLEFDVGLGDDGFGHVRTNCADVLQSRSFEGELPAARTARAREASTGRLLDLVATADGRLLVGDSAPHLQCPPCSIELN